MTYPEPIATLELEACDPPAMLQDHNAEGFRPTPAGLWLQFRDDGAGGWPRVYMRGPRTILEKFVSDHWGEETLEDVREYIEEESP